MLVTFPKFFFPKRQLPKDIFPSGKFPTVYFPQLWSNFRMYVLSRLHRLQDLMRGMIWYASLSQMKHFCSLLSQMCLERLVFSCCFLTLNDMVVVSLFKSVGYEAYLFSTLFWVPRTCFWYHFSSIYNWLWQTFSE